MKQRIGLMLGLGIAVVTFAGCNIDIGGPGPDSDISFVPDEGYLSGAWLGLTSFELFADGGVGAELHDIPDLASISYELAWDPSIATFSEARITPLGGLPDQSTLTAELVGGQGRLRVRHEIHPGTTETLSGIPHIIEFHACASCAGETGLFVQSVTATDRAGRSIGTTSRGGRLVVVRLR